VFAHPPEILIVIWKKLGRRKNDTDRYRHAEYGMNQIALRRRKAKNLEVALFYKKTCS